MGVSQEERGGMEAKFGMETLHWFFSPKDGTQQMRSTRLPEMSTVLLETAGVLNMNYSWGKEIVRISTPKLI